MDSTRLPNLTEMTYVQLSRPDAPNPRMANAISATATELKFALPILDSDGNVPTEALLIGIRDQYSYVETVYIPAGGLSGDGLTATGCVRGVRLDGLDWTTGDSDLAVSHKAGDAVYCNISGIIGALLTASINGTIATGGAGFTIGTEPGAGGETMTVYRTTTEGVKVGVIRWLLTTGKVQYSNDGAIWVNMEDVSASDLLKVSSVDTTPGYGEDKIKAGTNVTITKKNPGANEYLEIESSTSAHVDVEYTADEDITAGTPVSKTATADEVENTILSTLSDAGAESTFEANGTNFPASVRVADNKVAVVYEDSPTASWYIIIGTVTSDGTVTWGTRVEIDTSADNGWVDMVYIEDDKIAICYVSHTSEDLYARIVTVSGTVPTLGTASLVHNEMGTSQRALGIELVDTDKLIVAYADGGDSRKGKAKAATFSGTTIGTWGTAVEFEAGATNYISIVKFDTDRAGVFYQDDDDTNKGKGVLLVATGTTLATTSPVEFEASSIIYTSSVALATNKAILTYHDDGSNETKAKVASLSGLTISYGAEATINSVSSRSPSVDAIGSGTAYVVYEEDGASDGKLNKLSISGTTITVGAQYGINGGTDNIRYPQLAKLSDKNKFIICYVDEADSDKGNAEVFQEYDNVDECIGFAQSTVSATESVAVRSKGVDSNQTGLVTGDVYYLKSGGIESTNNSGIRAGVAKNTTSLDIDIDTDSFGKVYASGAETSITNTTTETEILKCSLKGKTLLTNNCVRGRIYITELLNNAGAGNKDFVFKFKYGSTTVATYTYSSPAIAAASHGHLDFELFANASASAQFGVLELQLFNGTADPDIGIIADGTATEDSSEDLDVVVTVAMETAAATIHSKYQGTRLEVVK